MTALITPERLRRPRQARPVRTSLALLGASLIVTIGGALIVDVIAPESDPVLRRLPVVLALLLMSVVVARRIGWREIAAGGPSTWRSLGLLVAPTVVALVPLAWGWQPENGTLAALTVGYLATGIYEELWYRGIMLRAALPLGPVRAAALTAVLFGAAHLANVAFGANIAVTLAQAVGATAGGFGYAILRQRTNAVWALAALHFASDLLLHTTGLHGAAMWIVLVGHDVALFAIGLLAIRGLRRQPEPRLAP
ncbi:MAG: CPBP family intramembrane metalloprotease [Actinomycetales bacterium]|nr:CPBP family intramembrane metalloprotease [Actinomycetales bacterium]